MDKSRLKSTINFILGFALGVSLVAGSNEIYDVRNYRQVSGTLKPGGTLLEIVKAEGFTDDLNTPLNEIYINGLTAEHYFQLLNPDIGFDYKKIPVGTKINFLDGNYDLKLNGPVNSKR